MKLGSTRAAALAAAAAVIGLDRWSKHAVEAWGRVAEGASPYGPPSVEVLGDALRLTYVRNPGMVFGLFARSSFPGRDLLLAVASVVAIALLALYFTRIAVEKRALVFGLALVLGGATGNLIDRFLHGYVVDFVDVSLHFARWPAFNLADSAIVVGVGLMALDLLAHPAREARPERARSA